jgi:hypothetical protein
MKKLEKIVIFKPAFDKRNPVPKENFGICSVRCFMVLKGKNKAVHFVFSTGMYLEKTHKEWLNRFPVRDHADYMGFDVGYHDIKPHFEEQEISQKHCEWLDGKPCYCDWSALRADDYMKVLVEKGSEAIWKLLEKDYKAL